MIATLRRLLLAALLALPLAQPAAADADLEAAMEEAIRAGDAAELRRLIEQAQAAAALAAQEPPPEAWEVAVDTGDLPALQRLVEGGFELNPADWFEHPLRHISPYYMELTEGHLDMIEWIVQQTGTREDYSYHLFDFVENDHVEGARVMLRAGVDPNGWIRNNRSAMDVATSGEMRELLGEHGAYRYFPRFVAAALVLLGALAWVVWRWLFRTRTPVSDNAAVAAQPERNRSKGIRYLIGGVCLLLGGFGSILLVRYGSVFGIGRPDLAGGFAVVGVGLVVAFVGVRMATIGKGLMTPDGDAVLNSTDRPLFLYLRAFGLDEEDGRHRMPLYMGIQVPINPWESGLAGACKKVGDMVAIGRPGEAFATTGAARVYVTDDQWQDKVVEMIGKTELVFWTYGSTEGLRWEIQRLVDTVPPEQLVVALPFWNVKPAQRLEVWQKAREQIDAIFPRGLPEDIGDSLFIAFDADWNARPVEPLPMPLFMRAAMLFGRNRVYEGVNGLLRTKGYTWPKPGFGTYLLCAIGFLAWTSVAGVLLTMIYVLIISIAS